MLEYNLFSSPWFPSAILTDHVDLDGGLHWLREVRVGGLARERGPVVGALEVGQPERVAHRGRLGVDLLHDVVHDRLAAPPETGECFVVMVLTSQ